jgi:hypothetical protein
VRLPDFSLSRLRSALITDRLTFHEVLLFPASLTLSQNLDAGIINDGFCALDFQVGRGLWHDARILARLLTESRDLVNGSA